MSAEDIVLQQQIVLSNLSVKMIDFVVALFSNNGLGAVKFIAVQ